jgi:uncharacterized damage-inducible protein DinB
MAADDRVLREQLTTLLKGGQAHTPVGKAIAGFPEHLRGERPQGIPYSGWQLLEHMRIAVSDLLDFATNSEYREKKWPEDYWPKEAAPPSAEAWERSARALVADLDEFARLVHDPNSNLYDTIPWGKHGETLLREVLLAADHTAYHTGELIVLRRLLGCWTP